MGLFGGSSKKEAENKAFEEQAAKEAEEKAAAERKKAAELAEKNKAAAKEAEARDRERKKKQALEQAERIKAKVAAKQAEKEKADKEAAEKAKSLNTDIGVARQKEGAGSSTEGGGHKSKINRSGGASLDEVADINAAIAKKKADREAKKAEEEAKAKKAREDAGLEEGGGTGLAKWNAARLKIAAAAANAAESAQPVKKEATAAQIGAARGAASAAGGVFYTKDENNIMLKKIKNLDNRVKELEKRNRILEGQLEDYAEHRSQIESGVRTIGRRASNAAASLAAFASGSDPAAGVVQRPTGGRRRSVAQMVGGLLGSGPGPSEPPRGQSAPEPQPKQRTGRRMSIGQRLGLAAAPTNKASPSGLLSPKADTDAVLGGSSVSADEQVEA
uniref:Uncharacterized protein n=1 Tax=Haptolina brevifila TaxID=156173 RepID=A0A7S2E4T4_9EUKA|mmetsp:Transcript_47418/g.94622  ORF Transcript_47418/g.94622 Transcript_47418/m.94622 type:complete len:389 (+) Transcript_47418:100-1266(+)